VPLTPPRIDAGRRKKWLRAASGLVSQSVTYSSELVSIVDAEKRGLVGKLANSWQLDGEKHAIYTLSCCVRREGASSCGCILNFVSIMLKLRNKRVLLYVLALGPPPALPPGVVSGVGNHLGRL
jgi:hypothetical protein